ncbi:A/G-specific DNA-adenine glycosylase [Chitinophaga skermanii]|uniref:A/G-specific DNA-adenine glycosylase n=1 Tax=Chitinophaga skermanii TaxID=331697 RepID=A0A327QAY2_9BACT|nr:hypothetical protein [Chitinophaga skermanii]RAJ01590.1 A/G-specific DNA-adenine glycosylase [Chitinophaga skermanii]
MHTIPTGKISDFQTKLLTWFYLHGRQFPWRETQLNPYQAIIAEVLLQRTKAETVAKMYLDFLYQYPDWQSILSTPIEQLEESFKPIGLYRQRASGLKRLAAAMASHQFELPSEQAALAALPLFGQYILNAITLVVLQKPAPLLDVNMARLLERYFGERKLADIRYDPYLQELAHIVVASPNSLELNWAMLDFAALICKAGKPRCELCMLQADCVFFQKIY